MFAPVINTTAGNGYTYRKRDWYLPSRKPEHKCFVDCEHASSLDLHSLNPEYGKISKKGIDKNSFCTRGTQPWADRETQAHASRPVVCKAQIKDEPGRPRSWKYLFSFGKSTQLRISPRDFSEKR